MRKRSVIRDTIKMTAVQFVLECLALWFQSWMTRRVGAETVGILALAGSFFQLAAEMPCSAPAGLCRRNWGAPAVVRHGCCATDFVFA